MKIVSKKTVRKLYEERPQKKDDERKETLSYQQYDRNASVGRRWKEKDYQNFHDQFENQEEAKRKIYDKILFEEQAPLDELVEKLGRLGLL